MSRNCSSELHSHDAERVETIAAWHMNAEWPKQWSELPFEQQVLIPRRSVPSGEKQATFVRMPRVRFDP